jgi:hypothetical protein
MRVVLYADDMEPITVIDLSELARGYLNERGMVRLSVMLPPMLSVLDATAPPLSDCKIVTIFAEIFIRNGRKHMMLFTHDEENALLLKCAFLPGQQSGLQERERTAFARGFLDALARVGAI